MRVLFVSPIVPWPLDCGGRIRTFKLIRALGAQVELHLRVVRQPDVDISAAEELRPFCASLRVFERGSSSAVRRWTRTKPERWFFSPQLERELAAELASDRFDAVHIDEMFLARSLPRAIAAPVVVHHHKLDTVLHEMLPAASVMHKRFEAWKLGRLETDVARAYQNHVVCSELDARTLSFRHPLVRCSIVPNGFDPRFFQPRDVERDPRRLLFLGSMSYGPNIDAVEHFVRDVMPLIRGNAVELDIVGRDPAPQVMALASERVRVIGGVSDVRPHLARAAMMVAPLRIGGGTRLKLVDALAMRCPVVATHVAAEGLDVVDGEHLRLADEPVAFARAVHDSLAQSARTQAMAARGRELVVERYSWDLLAQRLFDAWRDAADAWRAAAVASA